MTKISNLAKAFKLGLTALVMAGSCFVAGNASAGYVHTSGTKIVDGNGNPLFFTGTNLGNWLVWEGYLMMGVSEGDPEGAGYRTHSQLFEGLVAKFGGGAAGVDAAVTFEHEWRSNYVTEQTIIDLRAKGYNAIRVPFNYRLFWDGSKFNPNGLWYLDNLMKWCATHKMYVLLDMHGLPGYQNPGDHSDNPNAIKYVKDSPQYRATASFWDNEANVEIAAAVWQGIAAHFEANEWIWGYDLMNEPVPKDGEEYKLLISYKKITDAIRLVDKNHTIVVEGTWWAAFFNWLDWTDWTTQTKTNTYKQWDSNLVFETHHYPYKEEDVPLLFSRTELTNRLGVPFIVGEIGETPYADWQRTMSNWATMNTSGYFPWTAKKVRDHGAPWSVEVPAGSAIDTIMTDIKLKNYSSRSDLKQDVINFAKSNIGNGQSGVNFNQDAYQWTSLKANTPNLVGRYVLRNVQTKLVMGVVGASTTDKASIQQAAQVAGDTSQQFDLVDNGDGTYAVKNVRSGKVLDVPSSSQDNSKDIQQWAYYKGAANQAFMLYRVPGTNSYQLIAKHSGKSLEVPDKSGQGAPVQQRVDNNLTRSMWELLPVSVPFFYSQEAEANPTAKSGGVASQTQNGQSFMGGFVPGSWVAYAPQHFKVGTYKVTINAATAWTGMKIRFDLKNGTYVSADTIVPAVSGVWDRWQDVTMTIYVPVEGDYSLGINSSTGYVNVNRFKIESM